VKLTTHLHLVPRSKNEWRYTSTPQYAFMVWCSVKAQGETIFGTLVFFLNIPRKTTFYRSKSSKSGITSFAPYKWTVALLMALAVCFLFARNKRGTILGVS
jgi:hypothetical protein